MYFKKPVRDQAEAIFAARKGKPDFVEYEFVDYKGKRPMLGSSQIITQFSYVGTCHGFASRPNLGIPEIYEAHNAALEQTAAWLSKYLQ